MNIKKLIYSSVLTKIISSFFTFLSLVIIARILGPEIRGIVAYNLALVVTFSTILFLSITHSFSELVHRHKRLKVILSTNYLFLQLLLSIIMLVLIYVFHTFTSYKIEYLWFILVYIVLFSFQSNVISVYQSFNNLIFYNNIYMLAKVCLFIILVLFWFLDELNLKFVFISYIVADVIFMIIISKNVFSSCFNVNYINFKIILQYLQNGLKIHLSGIGTILISKANYIVLEQHENITYQEIGYYDVANQLNQTILLVFSALIPVIFTSALNSSFKVHLENQKKILKFSIIFLIPAICCLVFISPYLIKFIFGNEYMHSIEIFQFLSITILFNALVLIIGPLWVLLGYFYQTSFFVISLGLLNILLLNLYLPVYGLNALIVTAIVISFLSFLGNILFLRFINNRQKEREQ